MVEFENDRWQLVAFLGRYGHQQMDQVLEMTARDAAMLSRGITKIMNDEAEAMRKAQHV